MKNWVLSIGAIYGFLAVVFGAFGAHALKKIISVDKLTSFEVGVRYQMYHALLLLIIGFFLGFETKAERYAAIAIMIGTFLFSFSIYGLALSDVIKVPNKILGPITPLGGLFLIVGWGFLIFIFAKRLAA